MEFVQISSLELEGYINCRNCVIVDLRDKETYDEGHVPGAVNIPFENLEDEIGLLDKNKEFILYCERGGRSFVAAKRFGDTYNIKIVTGGMHSYKGIIEKSH